MNKKPWTAPQLWGIPSHSFTAGGQMYGATEAQMISVTAGGHLIGPTPAGTTFRCHESTGVSASSVGLGFDTSVVGVAPVGATQIGQITQLGGVNRTCGAGTS